MKIYLIRHGETDMNRRECLQGQIDSELNENGISEAKRAAQLIEKAGITFDVIYSSPLKRAFRTAEIIAGGKPVIAEPLIKEMYFGSYEGTPYRDIDEKMWAFIHDPENVPPPSGVESISSLTSRTGSFLKRVTAEDKADSVLAVTHGIAIRSMLWNLYDESSRSKVWGMPIENCVIYEAEVQGGAVVSVRKADELTRKSDSDTSGVF